MGKAKRARAGQTVTIIAGEHDGNTAIALQDGEGRSALRVQLKSGPKRGTIVDIATGNYIVGG